MGSLNAPEELRRQLEAVGTIVESERGTFLFRRGDQVSGVFLIAGGTVRLGLERDARAFPSRYLGAGAVIGLPAALSDSTYSLTAEVVEDARLIFVPRDCLLNLLGETPSLCFHAMNMLTEELVETRQALERVHKGAS
jgi:CRP-like cAMP-binding protein